MDPYWYLFLYALSTSHFFFLVSEVIKSPLYVSGWERYQAIYLLWLNSGSIAIVGISFAQVLTWMSMKNSYNSFRQLDDRIINSIANPLVQLMDKSQNNTIGEIFVGIYLMVLLLPIFFTHMISTMFIFIPITIIFACLWFGFMIWSGECRCHYRYNKCAKCPFYNRLSSISNPLAIIVLCRIIGTFSAIVVFQTFANYAAMFYSGMSWSDVIKNEFMNRDTRCYANAFINGLQVYNVGLAGLLLS
jgi:hypothetical protein